MILRHIVNGFVIQYFETDTNEWTEQEFVSSDSNWEGECGEAVDDEPEAPGLDTAMVQPVKPDTRTMAELAQEALDIQNACNLSGVVHSFHRSMARLYELLRETNPVGLSTSMIRIHPICIMFSGKIASLTNSDNVTVFSKALDDCSDLAR